MIKDLPRLLRQLERTSASYLPCPEDRKDAAMNAVVCALRNRPDNPEAYAMVAVRHRSIELQRSNAYRQHADLDFCNAVASDRDIGIVELRAAYQARFEELTDVEKTALKRRFVGEELLSTRSALHRARKKLRLAGPEAFDEVKSA